MSLNFWVEDGLTYMVMADLEFKRRLAYLFLQDLKDRFGAQIGQNWREAHMFAFNAEFQPYLKCVSSEPRPSGGLSLFARCCLVRR